jgi:ADP-ribose pyrophosphatase YjhB (NUDIX family)
VDSPTGRKVYKMQPYSHCHFCGAAFATLTDFPRHCANCGKSTFRNPLPVTVVLIPVAEGLLAVRRTITPHVGKFALPGGYINYGESWLVAGAREVLEETGITIDPDTLTLLDVMSAPDGALLLFAVAPPMPIEIVTAFIATDEASELQVVTDPALLAFPLHQSAMTQFMALPRTE